MLCGPALSCLCSYSGRKEKGDGGNAGLQHREQPGHHPQHFKLSPALLVHHCGQGGGWSQTKPPAGADFHLGCVSGR